MTWNGPHMLEYDMKQESTKYMDIRIIMEIAD